MGARTSAAVALVGLGAAAVIVGVALVYVPAAVMLVGVGLTAFGLFGIGVDAE